MAILKIQGVAVPSPSVMSWTISSYDTEGSRGIDGTLHRNMVAQKEKLDIEWYCANLTPQQISQILTLTLPEFFEVEFYSPLSASVVKKTMYVGDRETTFYRFYPNSEPIQDSLKFSLIER